MAETEVYYYWSERRKGWVVYAMAMLQSTSYETVELLKQDWPTAVSSGVTPETVEAVKKARLPYWLGGEKEGVAI